MGNKIITEKDFWMCSTGAVPAQLQGTRLGTKKKSGEVYITVEDKATSSFIDFGCTKYMLLAALAVAAAVVVLAVVGVLTVATGGAALIALGAVAGLVGAAIGGIVGGLLCGQKVASKRVWSGSKSNFISQGTKTITGDHTMTCAAGGTITFAPQIKNWSQAVALGGANYLGKLMEGMMAGAAVGMGGAILSGGAGAIATGGMRGLGQATLQFAKSMPKNFVVNAVESISKFGLALRGVMGVQNTAQTYGNTGDASIGDFAKGTVAMETGAYDSAKNIGSGNGTWQDYMGMAMMVAPVGQGKRDLEDSFTNKADEVETSKADKETTNKVENQEANAPKKEGDGEAYETEGISEQEKPKAGSAEHKAQRWKDYEERGGKWDYERWSKQYDTNMKNATYGLSREQAYRDQLGGKSETVKTPYTNRQIDISKPDEMYAGQLKTGKMSLNKQAKIDIQKDAAMVKQGYQVEYILEKGASKPFLQALEKNGIDYIIGSKVP